MECGASVGKSAFAQDTEHDTAGLSVESMDESCSDEMTDTREIVIAMCEESDDACLFAFSDTGGV